MEQQGLRLEDYLKYMGQSVDQFRASFMPQAEKQVKIRLALEAVAAAENIEASEDELNAESSVSLTSTRWKRTRFVSSSMSMR